MPTSRAHVFQLRTPQFSAKPPRSVTLNGKPLPQVSPPGRPADDGESQVAGWYVDGKQAAPSLLTAEGSLVVVTGSLPLRQAIEVNID